MSIILKNKGLLKCENYDINECIKSLPIINNRIVLKENFKTDYRKSVFLCYDKNFDKNIVVKFLLKDNIKSEQLEIYNYLIKNKNDNICDILEIGEIDQFYLIFMNYYNGINLKEYIENNKFNKNIFYKICDGIKFLHENNILHGDLKSSNIIINNLEIKIIDFDNSKIIKKEYKYDKNIVGTFPFIPREVIKFNRYYLKSDIWQLGALLICLIEKINLHINYDVKSKNDITEQNYKIIKNINLDKLINTDKNLVNVIKFMLVVNVAERYNINEIINKVKKLEY